MIGRDEAKGFHCFDKTAKSVCLNRIIVCLIIMLINDSQWESICCVTHTIYLLE